MSISLNPDALVRGIETVAEVEREHAGAAQQPAVAGQAR
jgi:hypothetical protein